jgi:WD40 repeat protein
MVLKNRWALVAGLIVLAGCLVSTARAGPPNQPKAPGNHFQVGDRACRAMDYGFLPPAAWACLGSPRFVADRPASSVAYSPDGKLLASGTSEYTAGAGTVIHLWDLSTGRTLHTLKGHKAVIVALRFTPDSASLVSAAWDNTIRVWDVVTGRELRQINGHQRVVTGLALTPDVKQLVSSSQDGTIRVWDFATGQELRRMSWSAADIALAADGNTLATAGGEALLWDIRTGKRIRPIGDMEDTHGVRFTPDGKKLAVRTGLGVSLWDVAAGKKLLSLDGLSRPLGALAFSPDGKVLATGGGGYEQPGPIFEGYLVELKLWDAAHGKLLQSCEGHTFAIADVAFSPDGQTLASASGDFSVRLWDWKAGREAPSFLGHSQEVTGLAFTPDARTLSSASRDGTVRLWDVVSLKETAILRGHKGDIWAMAMTPDGKVVASGGIDGCVRLWDVAAHRELRKLADGQGRVECAAFSPDGKLLAVGDRGYGGEGGALRLWDWQGGKELQRLAEQEGVRCVAFAPDGNSLVVAHHPQICVWDIGPGGLLKRMRAAHCEVGDRMGCLPDGTLASVGRGSEVMTHFLRLWDTRRNERVHEFGTGTGYRSTMAVSRDGRLVAAAFETTILVYEASTRHKVFEFRGHRQHVGALAFSPDGQTLATGGADGAILFWDLTGHRKDGRFTAIPWRPGELKGLWNDLATDERGRLAVWRLALSPREAVPYLAERVRPVAKTDPNRLQSLIADLDANEFATREKATRELENLGEVAVPCLEAVLEKKPTLELHTRVKVLLDRTESRRLAQRGRLLPPVVQQLRAIETLEWAGTRGARNALQEIAQGEPSVWQTQAARAALARFRLRAE